VKKEPTNMMKNMSQYIIQVIKKFGKDQKILKDIFHIIYEEYIQYVLEYHNKQI